MKNIHSGKEEGGTCAKCGRFFDSIILLKRHEQNKHLIKFQVCTICEKIFQGVKTKQVIDHYTKEHGVFCNSKNTFVCDICNIKMTSSSDLSQHYRAIHETKDDFQCDNCEHKEPTKALFLLHCIDTHEMDPFKDSLLNENTVQGVQIRDEETAFFKSNYTCTVCGKKLASKVTLKNHMKQYHDTSNHAKCDQCPRTFNYPSMLQKHILAVHTKATKFPCSQCSYVSNIKSFLNAHVRNVHEKRFRHKCSVCGSQYERPRRLQEHMLKNHDIVYKY